MAAQNSNEKEPLKLRIILPLVALIVIFGAVLAVFNLSKSSFPSMSNLEFSHSFSTYVSKLKERDHYKLFVGHKKVVLSPGAALDELLQDVDGRELISSVSLTYNIPVHINLVGDWIFNLKENSLQAQVPLPSFGEPAFDPLSLQMVFKTELAEDKKSVLKDVLKEKFAGYRIAMDPTTQASLESESLQQVQSFLQSWLATTYKNLPDFKYQITFTGSKSSGSPEEP